MKFKLVESLYNTIAYHGSQQSDLTLRWDYPLYLTNDESLAVEFANGYAFNYELLDGDTPTLYTFYIHIDNPFYIQTDDDYDKYMDISNYEFIIPDLESAGYDSIIYDDGELVYYMLFHPDKQATLKEKVIL